MNLIFWPKGKKWIFQVYRVVQTHAMMMNCACAFVSVTCYFDVAHTSQMILFFFCMLNVFAVFVCLLCAQITCASNYNLID